ncbi:MAG: Calx-beta domain-containing protein [Caldilineaceae bacterium]
MADVNVGESGGSAVFTVTLSVPNAEDVGASYATSNGSAIAGTDYTAASSVLTITAGLTVTTISVPILPDTLDEDDETFTTLSAPMGPRDLRRRRHRHDRRRPRRRSPSTTPISAKLTAALSSPSP